MVENSLFPGWGQNHIGLVHRLICKFQRNATVSSHILTIDIVAVCVAVCISCCDTALSMQMSKIAKDCACVEVFDVENKQPAYLEAFARIDCKKGVIPVGDNKVSQKHFSSSSR